MLFREKFKFLVGRGRKIGLFCLVSLVFLLLIIFAIRAGAENSGGYELKLLSGGQDFAGQEGANMEFKFKKKRNFLGEIGAFARSFFVDDYKNIKIEQEVVDAVSGKKIAVDSRNVQYEKNGKFKLVLESRPRDFRPGKYRVNFRISDPQITGSEGVIMTQDFTWGVLAFNSNKSIYNVGDTADFSMGVVDDEGHTVCGADMDMDVIAPDGSTVFLGTALGRSKFSLLNRQLPNPLGRKSTVLIQKNPECGPDNVIDKPDYFAKLANLKQIGKYTVKLIAHTSNGERTISDSFEVRDKQAFDIEREGPTRINPKFPYVMHVNLMANEDFDGDMTEVVPQLFKINNYQLKIQPQAENNEKDFRNLDVELKESIVNDSKILTWSGVKLKKGEKLILSYAFDAPDTSPDFFLSGPFQLKSDIGSLMSEIRNWQIASDALDFARAKTVVFPAGNFTGDGTTGQQSDTNQSFAAFNFRLAEQGVVIKNAYLVFESQFSAYADDGTYTGYTLSFDSCSGSCTPNAWTGTSTASTTDANTLAYNETGNSNHVRLLLSVGSENDLASYAGNNAVMTGRIGYNIRKGAATNAIASAKAFLVLTYTYDRQSPNYTNTVYYPLNSSDSGQGTKSTSTAVNCAFGSTCPKFTYNMDMPDFTTASSTKLAQWFQVSNQVDANTTNQVGLQLKIGSNATSTNFIHEAGSVAALTDLGSMLDPLFDNVAGFAENTAQTVEQRVNGTAATTYLMGGETAETYISSSSAPTKTRTVALPIGIITNALTIASTTGYVDVRFPENGTGTGNVTIKSAWLRITTSDNTTGAKSIAVDTKVGANATSTIKTYNFDAAGNSNNPSFNIVHIIPSSDYVELANANGTTTKRIILETKKSSAASTGGVSAELVITYTYTSEATGYLASMKLFGGQTTNVPNTGPGTITINSVASMVRPDIAGTSTILAGGILMSFLRQDSDGTVNYLSPNTDTYDSGLSTGVPACTAAHIILPDSINDFGHFYKSVTANLSLTNNQAYNTCYAQNLYDSTAQTTGAKMNGQIIYTYAVNNTLATSTVFSIAQRKDASGYVDLTTLFNDANGDQLRAQMMVATGTSCLFTPALTIDPTLDTSNVTASSGAVTIDNNSVYQIGTSSNTILTSSGQNTVNFGWFSKTDLNNYQGTSCVAIIANDTIGDQSPVSTTTVWIDNYPPQVSGVVTSDLMYGIGDTLQATITVATDADIYTLASSSINGATSSTFNLQKVNNTTYTVDYLVTEGNTDRATGTIPYVIVLRDTYGNISTSTGVLTNGSIDAHAPVISGVTAPDLMYGIGSTLRATITVSVDPDIFILATSSINWATSSTANLQKINNTTYTIDYTVIEGDTNRASGTIPIYLVIKDSYGNFSAVWTTLTSNASLDAVRPVINNVWIPNGTYGIGSNIALSIAADQANYTLGNTTVNTMTISPMNLSDSGGGSYSLSYVVQENDPDRTINTIPVSIILKDAYGNDSLAFTAPAYNTATIDAHRPEILTISLPNLVYKIGDTIRATTTVTADSVVYTLGTTTINGVAAQNLVKINNSTYTFDYVVQSGNADRSAGTIPVSLMLKDGLNQYNNPASTTVQLNTASIDANAPTISSVSFAPSSGVLKIGDTATATITAVGNETGLLANSLTINGKTVTGTFTELGGGQYRVIYTVQDGDTDRLDSDDLPINFSIKDTAGNISANYTTADSGNRPGVDAHAPTISSVSFAPSSGVLKIGDTATATITAVGNETGLLANSLTINGKTVTGTFTELGGGQYRVIYTVQDGDTDRLDSDDLPINFSIKDTAGNISANYTTADSGNRPGVDAHAPTIPGNLSFNSHSNTFIVINFGATTTESNFSEYKIFYKAGSSGATESDNEWNQINDANLNNVLFNGAATTTISGLLVNTQYVFNIWAYDSAGNKASAAIELVASTNAIPGNAASLVQLKNNEVDEISNGNWTQESVVKLRSQVIDVDADEVLSLYYEVILNTDIFTIDASQPTGACLSGTSYNSCSSKIWVATSTLGNYSVTPFEGLISISALPDSSVGYKWQVLTCDNNGACSNWVKYNTSYPNFKVDTIAPQAPGNLSEGAKTSTSIVLNLGATTTESNFKEYKIFYKVGSSGVTENDLSHASSTDANLADILFNGATTTVVSGLSANTEYVFNIWAYDQAGNKANAAEMVATTDLSSNPPTGVFNSVAQKTDGSGAVDVSIEVDDFDNNDTLRAKLEYEAGVDCVFSAPEDPTLDASDINISADYGDPDIDNDFEYQLGTTTNWILTSPGSNTVNFDWLSKADLPNESGLYCLRLTVNDGYSSQLVAATTTIYIDNIQPSAPGQLSLNSRGTYSLDLNFGASSTEENFDYYKIFYKQGLNNVTENDTELIDANLTYQDYNNKATTSISGLSAGTGYVINIWAYDAYGNKASSTEINLTTNYVPQNPASLVQLKNDGSTEVANNGWTNESLIKLKSSVWDSDTNEILTIYYQFVENVENLTIDNSEPNNACVSGTEFNSCVSKFWKISSVAGDYSLTPFVGEALIGNIPDSSVGYKWQALVCDDNHVCSSWVDKNFIKPNLKVDTTPPSSPGNLTFQTRTYNSITLNFGASTTENNFSEYRIYYKQSVSDVTELDNLHGSSTDNNLIYQNYNDASTTTISGLLENTQYVFNIWAYDLAGNKSKATEAAFFTNNRPVGLLASASSKTNGTGAIDIAIQVSDSNSSDSKAKIEYVSGSDCNFSSSFDPTLDQIDANATSTYGDAKVLNSDAYQIGNSSGWIVTSFGANTVNFDWLSQLDIDNQEGFYCLRLTANDQTDDQASPATTTIYVDNKNPTQPGELTLNSKTKNSITLNFGATTTETNFAYYKIFYRQGAGTVSDSDNPHNDTDLNNILFNGTATTTISGLLSNTQYGFKIFAYDVYGNVTESNQTIYTTNAPPTGSFNSVSQKTNGSGLVDVSIEVYDADGDQSSAKIDYVSGSDCNFSSPLDPTLDDNSASISADYGTVGIDNLLAYQIGTTTSKIITASGSNTINFDWKTKLDIPDANGDYCLRLTVDDGYDAQITPATAIVMIDNVAPTNPGNLTAISVSGTSVEIGLGATTTEANFEEYKIFYKAGDSGVTENDFEYNQFDDEIFGNILFNGEASTLIGGFSGGTQYVFNIWAYDLYGNKSSSTLEMSTTTAVILSATWREFEDASIPTTGSYLGRNESVRLRLAIANSGEWTATDTVYQIEYGEKGDNCDDVASWNEIPTTASSEHFQMVDSLYFNDGDPTSGRLSSDGYTFIPGEMLKSKSTTSPITLIGGSYTEIEYLFEANSNAVAGQTYCFRATNDGLPVDTYNVYPEATIAPPPVATFNSAQQKKDGSGKVDVSIEVSDLGKEKNRAKLEYVLGANCDFTSPFDPTIDLNDASIVADFGDPEVDNNQIYQIGTTSGMIITQYGSNTVDFDWLADFDLPNADAVYCLRLTTNDGQDDQLIPATTTLIIDHVNPTVPGNLSLVKKTSNSVKVSFATSSDTNFKEYRIYYKEGSFGVTESDQMWASTSDANLGFVNLNGATSTTITGLQVNKQYVFKVWAYDQFGNKSASSEELVVIIRYRSKTENWRWYNDQQNETPTEPLAGEDTTPANINDGSTIKLRLAFREIEDITGSNIKMRLQYSTFSDFSSDVNFVGEKGSTTVLWTYGDGVDDDNDSVTAALLNGVSIGASHNESGTSSSSFVHNASSLAEWEFTIRNNSAPTSVTYYFRAFDVQGNEVVAKNDGFSYPSVITEAGSISLGVFGVLINETIDGVTTNIESTPTSMNFGSLVSGNEGVGMHRFNISTNAGGGYQLFVMQRQSLLSSNGSDIDPVSGTNEAPISWPNDISTSAFGYHSGDENLSGLSPSRFSPNNSYARFENTMKEVSYSQIPVSNEQVDLIYRLGVGDSQEAGEYETEIVYILVPTFYE